MLALVAAVLVAWTTAPQVLAVPQYADTIERPLRYRPDGTDFVIENGREFFNRPLYGVPTAFRVDGGDRPEFVLYLPGRGGNLRLALQTSGGARWLHEAALIETRYRPGSLRYTIRDPLLGDATLEVVALALFDTEAFVVRAALTGPAPADLELVWAYGGVNGKRGRRDGDIGTENVPIGEWFQLQPEFAAGNRFTVADAGPDPSFTLTSTAAEIRGLGPTSARYVIADAVAWKNADPAALLATAGYAGGRPVIVGRAPLTSAAPVLLGLQRVPKTATPTPAVELATYVEAGGGPAPATAAHAAPGAPALLTGDALPTAFAAAEAYREKLAQQLVVETPDPFVNAAVAALNVATEGVWDEASGTVQHGAVAWRSRLLGWRGAYALDALGWHDRARRHLTYWPTRQLTTPIPDEIPPADAAANLSRAEAALHSHGAMSTGHYDMNLVFIDALFRHLRWTGDLALARELWPTIERHLAWEQRLFRRPYPGRGDNDPDTLPLYEAYAAIWASDDLFYSGGGATHSTAYNLFHHREAARLARLLGHEAAPYEREADLIARGLARELWLPELGQFAEWRDWLGRREAHPGAAAWTFYHAVDSGAMPTPTAAWEMARFMDTHVAHFPLRGPDVPEGFHTRPTTNWMPYMWSINNVVMGEVVHTALGYWQAGRPDAAWRLWKGAVLDSMFMGICPGNVGTTTAFDMARGESQRDFADPGGALSRSLVEGLFGVQPDALAGELVIRPGWPAEWEHVRFHHPQLDLVYSRSHDHAGQPREHWEFRQRFASPLRVRLQVRPPGLSVRAVGSLAAGEVKQSAMPDSVGQPLVEFAVPPSPEAELSITWASDAPIAVPAEQAVAQGEAVDWALPAGTRALEVRDPQGVLAGASLADQGRRLQGRAAGALGHRTLFLHVEQRRLRWWLPVTWRVAAPLTLRAPADQPVDALVFSLENHGPAPLTGTATLHVAGHRRELPLALPARTTSAEVSAPVADLALLPGTAAFTLAWSDGRSVLGDVVNWRRPAPADTRWDAIPLTAHLNDRVTEIFRHDYLTPRSPFTSLSMPKQGIGSWCKPQTQFEVDDRGLRAASEAGGGRFMLPNGIPFVTPGTSAATAPNVLFTSLWDNFPDAATVPLHGRARHVYLLMAGSTHAMQSQFDNGEIVVRYTDGTSARLALHNPTTWWPIEQDYVIDDFAFRRPEPIPPRVDLATGQVRFLDHASTRGRGLNDVKIPGGAATVLDLPLDPAKDLESLTVRALANEVVIGLMAATLVR